MIPRQSERRQIVELLDDSAVRMVTLVGAPGAGKTRLAKVVFEELRGSFSEGAVFVDLTTVQDPTLVPAAVATAIGVREGGDRYPPTAFR